MPDMAGGALSGTAGKSTADVALQREALLGQHPALVSDMMRDFGRLAAFIAHDEMLTRQVDATASKDYPQAHQLADNAYQDMFGLARQLSDAFGETVAAKLPQGGGKTWAGGTAGAPGTR